MKRVWKGYKKKGNREEVRRGGRSWKREQRRYQNIFRDDNVNMKHCTQTFTGMVE